MIARTKTERKRAVWISLHESSSVSKHGVAHLFVLPNGRGLFAIFFVITYAFTIPMSLFHESILREIATAESFRRGRSYVSDGAVEDASLSRDEDGNLSVKGTVYGSTRYQTSLLVDATGSEVIAYDCDCPYSQSGACKHVVALGLVAARRSVVSDSRSYVMKTQAVDAGLMDVLRTYAKQRGAKVDESELRLLANKMDKLLVKRGTASLSTPRPQSTVHAFDHITFAFDYDRSHDWIRVQVIAHYGPLMFPLLDHESTEPVQLYTQAARDWEAEQEAAFALRRCGFESMTHPGLFVMPASGAFHFLRDQLPLLADTYDIRSTDAFDALSHPKKVASDSSWSFEDGKKENWFSFSVDWKVDGRELTPDEIWQLAHGFDPPIRANDGTFLEIENVDAIRRYVEAMGDFDFSRQKKSHTISFSRALELQLLAEGTVGARVTETQNAVGAFLRDAQAGNLLVSPNIPARLSKILRPYQREGVEWAMFLRRYGFGGILADDMGLGKTLQALTILSTQPPKDAGSSLIICPKSVVSTWIEEARRFTPNLHITSIEGTAVEREKLIKSKVKKKGVLVTSYALFQRDAKSYRDLPLYYVVLDEAQYVKNSKSLTATAVKTLRPKHRLALTGTPLENGVHELWSLYDFLMPGLLGDHASFRQEFERPIRDRADTEALARLKRRVKPFLLRRTKESVAPELPLRIEQTGWCSLSPVQTKMYADVLASARQDVYEVVARKGFERSRIEILAALTRLRQVCNHPALLDKTLPHSEESSGKMSHTLELVREAAQGGHKVLLFSQFTSMLDILREGLDRMKIGHVTIEGKTQNRGKVVEQFRHDTTICVFLLSLRAAGTGLTLTEADTVILYDPWWNPMVERQAMDRAHRIGQTKCVNVHKLACKGTIEERVLALQERKKAVFNAVVSDNAEGMKGLTWEDVKGLFE